MPLPAIEILQQIKAYGKNPLLSASSCILEDMSTQVAASGSSSNVGSHPAIMLLPGHAEVEMSSLAKSCCCCNTAEGGKVRSSMSQHHFVRARSIVQLKRRIIQPASICVKCCGIAAMHSKLAFKLFMTAEGCCSPASTSSSTQPSTKAVQLSSSTQP